MHSTAALRMKIYGTAHCDYNESGVPPVFYERHKMSWASRHLRQATLEHTGRGADRCAANRSRFISNPS